MITPLYKKGKKSDPQNYRPISLTCLVCKITESIIKDCILNPLNKFSLTYIKLTVSMDLLRIDHA